jgi:hypothetical protein
MDPDSMTAFWKRSLGMRGELIKYLQRSEERGGRRGGRRREEGREGGREGEEVSQGRREVVPWPQNGP